MTQAPMNLLLEVASPAVAWERIFGELQTLALSGYQPAELHAQTVMPDRWLAESAWELWLAYSDQAPKTSRQIYEWWTSSSPHGKAVLIIDAMSLRELPALLDGAKQRGIVPNVVKVTGAEAPSDTDQFARALGLPSRSSLTNNRAPSGFKLCREDLFTDVLNLPFEDCISRIPFAPHVFVWHTWLDDLIHQATSPDHIFALASKTLRSDGFWQFVDRLRQGRQLIITADHGYATSRNFSTEERDPEIVEALRRTFGASRYRDAAEQWTRNMMPPVVTTVNGAHVVMGQRKWKVQSGFPSLCHGGLSLLEVAVPFIELPSL